MCVVSDKIKFCTCVKGSYRKLPNYWLLYRFSKKKDIQCMGMPIFPYELMQSNYNVNQQTIIKRLNEGDAFDKKIEFKSKDLLEIVLNNLSDKDSKKMIFCFVYKKGNWVAEEYDPFDLMNRYDELTFGNFDKLGE